MPILADNVAWLIRLPDGVAAVDPGEPGPILAAARARGWKIDSVLLTHHHGDHIGGAEDLRRETGARILGPRADGIAFVDEDLVPGERKILGAAARVFEAPGHTRHHVAILFDGHLFAGDILFVMGCGRLFEGPPGPFYEAIRREILPLSDDTLLYPGHDYAAKNLPFARSIDPTISEETPAPPVRLGEEKRRNPFLRARDAADFARRRSERDDWYAS